MMETNNQQRYEASRTAALIEKNADLYQRCPNFKWMVDNTIWLTEDQIHESMRVTGNCKELPPINGFYA